jgi:hypothetical protein
MRTVAGAVLFMFVSAVSIHAQGDSPGARLGTAAGQAAVREAARKSEPTPRLPDGTPNLGRVGTEKGIWGLPGVLNFAQMAVGGPKNPDPRLSGPETGGAEKEPWIPFQPWSAAVSTLVRSGLQLQLVERFEI